MLETLDYTIRIGSTPTFLYFDKYGLRWSYKNFLISQSTTYSYQAETLRNLCAKHSEDITRWCEDMNFIFEWWKTRIYIQYKKRF